VSFPHFIASPPRPGTNDYVVQPDFLEGVRAFYFDYRPDELAYRDLPDGYHSTWFRGERGGRVFWLLRNKINMSCIEVSWKIVNGAQAEVQIRPLPPEEAYATALESDRPTESST